MTNPFYPTFADSLISAHKNYNQTTKVSFICYSKLNCFNLEDFVLLPSLVLFTAFINLMKKGDENGDFFMLCFLKKWNRINVK